MCRRESSSLILGMPHLRGILGIEMVSAKKQLDKGIWS